MPATGAQVKAGDQSKAAGPAAFLAVAVVPGTLPADGLPALALFVELLDSRGQAAVSAQPVAVRLRSGDAKVAKVPASVIIPPNTSAAVVAVVAGLAEGETIVTAEADGLTSAQAQIKTSAVATAAEGGKLHVAFAPPHFIPGAGGPALLSVTLVSAKDGTPLVPRTETSIALVSSNPAVIAVPEQVTVPAGSYTATVPVTVGTAGLASVTALRSGFASGSTPASVGVGSGEPIRLTAVAVPPVLLPQGGVQGRLVVSAVDTDDRPVPFPCGALSLASAAPGVADVPAKANPECGPDQQAVTVDLIGGDTTGATTITVAAPGLRPGDVGVAAAGSSPTRLVVTPVPPVLLYGQPSAGWLVLQAVNDRGASAAVNRDTVVTLTGEPGLVPARATIPRGVSAIVVPLGAIASGERPQVTAAAPGLQAAEIIVRSTAGAPQITTGGGGGAQTPEVNIAGKRIPVTWILLTLAVAAVGLVVVMISSGRRREA